MLAQPVAHSRPVIQTPKAMRTKTEQFRQQIQASVEQELMLAKREQDLLAQGMRPDEIQKILDQERTNALPQDLSRKNYQAQGEIIFSKLMQYELNRQNVKTKKADTLKDVLTAARLCVYCGWQYGQPYMRVVNMLNLDFFKNENEPRLEKADYVYHMDTITAAELIQEYGNRLSDDIIEKMIGGGQQGSIPYDTMKRPMRDWSKYYSTMAAAGETFNHTEHGLAQSSEMNHRLLDREINRIHCEFKAFRLVIFLSHKDEYGQTVTEKLSGEADVIPEYASEVEFTNRFFDVSKKWVWVDEVTGVEYEAELLWIPRRHEFTILDDEEIVDYREVPLQPDYHENPFADFELSYKGRILYNRNAPSIAPLMRALPTAFQYMSVKRLIDREMAKYEGKASIVDTDQIPSNLASERMGGAGGIEDAVLRSQVIARKTGVWYYSGSNTRTGALPQSTRSIGVQHQVIDTASQMIMLQQLATLINTELGMVLGIPAQSEGQMTPGTNARDNQQSIIQHTISNQIIFYYLEEVWNSCLDEHMKNVLQYIRMNMDDLGYGLETILPDQSIEFFKILPEDVEFMEDLGLTLYSNGREQLYFDMMTNQVFSIAQNAGEGAVAISGILKALTTSSSPEEMHNQIQLVAADQAKRIAEQQEREAELQKANVEQMLELERIKTGIQRDAQIDAIRAKGIENARAADIQASMLERQADINENAVADKLEEQREQNDFDREENEKDRKLQLQLARIKSSKQS